jgi:hypothetical protein
MVSKGLRTWFVIHFVVDVLFALPLFLAPEPFLSALGWQCVDPVAPRLVAAALFGIGIESLLCRHQGREVFLAMLNLKVIWSAVATAGLLWVLVAGAPPFAWALFSVFLLFHAVWLRYWIRLKRSPVPA